MCIAGYWFVLIYMFMIINLNGIIDNTIVCSIYDNTTSCDGIMGYLQWYSFQVISG